MWKQRMKHYQARCVCSVSREPRNLGAGTDSGLAFCSGSLELSLAQSHKTTLLGTWTWVLVVSVSSRRNRIFLASLTCTSRESASPESFCESQQSPLCHKSLPFFFLVLSVVTTDKSLTLWDVPPSPNPHYSPFPFLCQFERKEGFSFLSPNSSSSSTFGKISDLMVRN